MRVSRRSPVVKRGQRLDGCRAVTVPIAPAVLLGASVSALLVVVFSGTRQHGNFIGARVVLLSVEVTDILQPILRRQVPDCQAGLV